MQKANAVKIKKREKIKGKQTSNIKYYRQNEQALFTFIDCIIKYN